MYAQYQERLRQLQYELKEAEIPTVVVLEGWGASGKGGVIQRLSERLEIMMRRGGMIAMAYPPGKIGSP